jgi:AmmeMemoRadiSam system protein A
MEEFKREARDILLRSARDSIAYGLTQHKLMPVIIEKYPDQLQSVRACFVTLLKEGMLRGCIGSLTAHQPLINDVVNNAFNAAFHDPRFPPLQVDELPLISLDISVLSKPQPLLINSESELYQKLRPGIDGLILSDNGQRATFLPSVWDQLPNPHDFVSHLKNKAGWASDYWSPTMQIETYTSELIS